MRSFNRGNLCRSSSSTSKAGRMFEHPRHALTAFIHVHLWLTLCFMFTGCGYSTVGGEPSSTSGYQWRSLYREDVRTVAVPIFTNKTFRRGVEFQLTGAIVRQLEAKSPYKVVPKERADTILEGEIVDIHLQN